MYRTRKPWRTILVASAALALTFPTFARSQGDSLDSPRPSDSPPGGNTTMKVSEQVGNALRDEAATEADHMLNQRIRQALSEDTALAVAAQSVFIITDKGEVTLHGSVATEKEKADISAKVQQVNGVKKLTNQLQMAPPDLRGGAANDSMSRSADRGRGSSSSIVTQ